MPVTADHLLNDLRARCRDAGLLGPAVAPAAAPAGASEALGAWLDAGHHGEMAYMARTGERRADPGAWAPWARSVALFADSYDVGPPPGEEPGRGVISRYARGTDYHTVMMDKIRAVSEPLLAAGYRRQAFVDTSPLMERALAAAGGLGWIGKNGNLLTRSHGSWVFLGGLVTDARWPRDAGVKDGCADCSACIPSCPTAAIVSPGVIDARRCISYLTIELKGAIPADLRPAVGNRIFGCDDCQVVCPWNEDQERGTELAYAPRPGLDSPDLNELAVLSEQEFFDRFRGTPVRRARWRGLLRNVMVALGNLGTASSLEGLRHGVEHPEPLVRSHAAWGLGKVGGQEACRLLDDLLDRETDPAVLREARAARAGLRSSERRERKSSQTEKE